MKVRAIVIDGRYKNLKLGSIHNVVMMNEIDVELEGDPRIYLPSICAYVDEDGRKLTIRDAIRLVGRRK